MIKAELLTKLRYCIEKLQKLSPDEFYDLGSSKYDPVRTDIARLVLSIDVPVEVQHNFFDGKDAVHTLLPELPGELETMPTHEIVLRLISHNSAERWADGMLAKPFESGVYVRALELVESRFKLSTDVWNWYLQFSHAPGETDNRSSDNFLRRVSQEELIAFKTQFGDILPTAYERFLTDVGSGYVRADITGRRTPTYTNEFLSLGEISSILLRETVEWEVYPDFIGENEVPFFSIGNNSVFVFNCRGERVHFPLNGQTFANSIEEFMAKLMGDAEFFTSRERLQ